MSVFSITDGATRILEPRYGGDFTSDASESMPFVLPGELIEASSTQLPRVLEASPDRVEPGCVHFGSCGGCHYQHAAYPAQLGFKRKILKDVLKRAGVPWVEPVGVHWAAPWGYRNRIRLRVERGAEPGHFALGYSRRASNDFLPIRMCPIAAPLLWRAAEAIGALGSRDGLAARWLGSTAEAELFCLPDESRLQMMLWLRDGEAARDGASFATLCERLRAQLPELVGAGAELDPELSRRTRRQATGAAWGAAGLAYPAAGRAYWVSRGAFFQVNRLLLDRLVELVCAGQSGALAWDLFAGVGLFSQALAERFARVVSVEAGEAAARDLAVAARRCAKSLGGITAVRSPVLDFLRAQELQRERPELVVLDPPRAGLGVEGAASLGRLAIPRVVYVSCDPVTLARDLAVLGGSYRIDSIDLIDLFPQTFHLETVVRMSRLPS